MILSGTLIADHQSCVRRTPLSARWRVLRWRPKSLFDACLRRAIVSLSHADDPIKVAALAVETFMQAAANPGLDLIGQNPYELARDWCVMLEILIRILSKTVLLSLTDVPDQDLCGNSWRVMAHADDSGTLHRWITASRWDEDDLSRELHGWHSFGDIVMTGQPMRLHVIQIGQMRRGRQVGPWARGFKHPTMPWTKLRFRRPGGEAFNGWKGVQLSELKPDYDAWATQMWDEGMSSLISHLDIKVPSEAACACARGQLLAVASQIQTVEHSDWNLLPMSRSACDGIVPCPWQDACYGNGQIESLGLYQRRA